jgi:hypothetical protein
LAVWLKYDFVQKPVLPKTPALVPGHPNAGIKRQISTNRADLATTLRDTEARLALALAYDRLLTGESDHAAWLAVLPGLAGSRLRGLTGFGGYVSRRSPGGKAVF